MISDQYLVWIDLEMSGLDANRDVILEIATIITDNNLQIIAYGPSLVINQKEEILQGMSEWCVTQHTASGLSDKVRASTITVLEAQKQTLDFIQEYCKPQTAVLAGNSIHKDLEFLRYYMPDIVNFLHYRIIDVSSVKEVVRRWYPNDPNFEFKKKKSHRALEDIEESIQELAHYRKYFFRE